MKSDYPFQGEPANTRERIMRATYATLDRYGYAGISIQRIADEAGLSKGGFYNHYEDKDELLLAFLDFTLERFREEFELAASGDPVADLNALLTHAISGTPPQSVREGDGFRGPSSVGALMELRAQAVSNETYRARFTRLDGLIAQSLSTIIQQGIDEGVFRDVNPERAAEVLLALSMGSILRRTTVEKLNTELLRSEVDRVLQDYLIVEGP